MKRWVLAARRFGWASWFLLFVGCDRSETATKKSRDDVATASSVQPDPSAALAMDGELQVRVRARLSALGSGYQARTRHKHADGMPKYTNRLILETSPYLLQHAHNPVQWFPWGEEGLAKARELNRPIFLSVGYSTCHWCHVMEEESFEDEEIARVLNEHYVPIKVDREQRPDIDSIYMTAVRLMTRRGGWPMSVWLTPKLEPFFGGTYFPPRDGVRGARLGLLTLLRKNADDFEKDPEHITAQSSKLAERLRQVMRPPEVSAIAAEDVTNRAVRQALQRFDPRFGGSRGAPKFPSSFPLRFLLHTSERTHHSEAREAALHTLRQLARGGIYDHVGGGFHRYSTDPRWLVPHFEKMLYDNALLVLAYLDAWQLTHEVEFRVVVEETLDYVLREMTDPAGCFYSATDADSLTSEGERKEGYYFTWTPEELDQALGAETSRWVRDLYHVSERGNFEGRSILFLDEGPEALARARGQSVKEFLEHLRSIKARWLAARSKRPPPLRDEKIQTNWNGLMISAFARAGRILNEARYLDAARRCARFVEEHLRAGDLLRHDSLSGAVSEQRFLSDDTFFVGGLLDLLDATSEPGYLQQAIELMQGVEKDFADADRGGYYRTPAGAPSVLVREKPDQDQAIPSGNSWAVMNHLRLYQWTLAPLWQERAEATFRAFGSQLTRSPGTLNEMLLALEFLLSHPKQILIALPEASGRNDTNALQAALRDHFVPAFVLAFGDEATLANSLQPLAPWVGGKPVRGGRATAYVCEQGSCRLPTVDARKFVEQLTVPDPGTAPHTPSSDAKSPTRAPAGAHD